MNKFILLILSSLVFLVACNDSMPNPSVEANEQPDSLSVEEKTDYDAKKATEYDADDYGMKQYVMAFLKKGPNRDLDSTRAMELQMKHLKNIERMAAAGDLILAGPFMDTGEVRGIYIFNVKTIEEAEALTNTDPAIKAGSLVMELRPWYGSAALMGINEMHKRLQKKGITEE